MSMTQIDPSAGGSAARSTRGRVPLYSPRLNGEDFDISVTDMQLTFTEGQHDMATLSCVSETLEDTEDLVDKPMSFFWGMAPRTQPFYGYIVDVNEEQKSQGSMSFKLSLLGPTKILFEGQPRFWSNKTISSALRDLVSSSKLGMGGHLHTFVWNAIAQTEESDWTMVNKLARRIGYAIFSRLGVVVTYDPFKLYKESGIYTRLRSGVDDLATDDRKLLSFEAAETAAIMKGNLGTRVGYFTSDDKIQLTKQPGEFKGYIFETGLTIRNQTEAAEHIKAFDTSFEDWGENGVARIWGEADIAPGMCVEITTAVPRYRYAKNDGRWLVRAAGHQADRQQYQTILFLTRPDKAKRATFAPSNIEYKPFWEEEPGGARPKPTLSLLEDRWMSSWRVSV